MKNTKPVPMTPEEITARWKKFWLEQHLRPLEITVMESGRVRIREGGTA